MKIIRKPMNPSIEKTNRQLSGLFQFLIKVTSAAISKNNGRPKELLIFIIVS
jgi:hypothetical protein